MPEIEQQESRVSLRTDKWRKRIRSIYELSAIHEQSNNNRPRRRQKAAGKDDNKEHPDWRPF